MEKALIISLILCFMVSIVMAIEWRISGDRDVAIKKLKGLGLNWLYKVKNWKKLGNLFQLDSGWKKYPDGDVRVVSFGDYDKIYINAGGKEVVMGKIIEIKNLFIKGICGRTVGEQWYEYTRVESRLPASGLLKWAEYSDILVDSTQGAPNILSDETGVYTSGYNSNETIMIVEKRSNSGTLLWQCQMSYPSGTYSITSISQDSKYIYAIVKRWPLNAIVHKIGKRTGESETTIDTTITIPYGSFSYGGYLYICGADSSATARAQLQKIDISSGNIEWSVYDTYGISGCNFNFVMVDSSGIYINGKSYYNVNPNNRPMVIQHRLVDDGSLIWGKTIIPTATYEYVFQMAIDNNYLYTTYKMGASKETGLHKRNKSDGDVVNTYVYPTSTISVQATACSSGSFLCIGTTTWNIVGLNKNDLSEKWSESFGLTPPDENRAMQLLSYFEEVK